MKCKDEKEDIKRKEKSKRNDGISTDKKERTQRTNREAPVIMISFPLFKTVEEQLAVTVQAARKLGESRGGKEKNKNGEVECLL